MLLLRGARQNEAIGVAGPARFGTDHLGLLVPDVDAAILQLRQRGVEIFGKWVADTLAADGWPRAERPERPWYHSPWFWGIVLCVGVAAALGAGGGGGGSGGSSGGTVAVIF